MEHLHCSGWWEQEVLGRQYMDGLMIVIEGRRITGSGMDVVGAFTFEGMLEADNSVNLSKQYLGQHRVVYQGRYDGVQRLWGHWRMNLLRGPWEIVIKFRDANREAHERELMQPALATTEILTHR